MAQEIAGSEGTFMDLTNSTIQPQVVSQNTLPSSPAPVQNQNTRKKRNLLIIISILVFLIILAIGTSLYLFYPYTSFLSKNKTYTGEWQTDQREPIKAKITIESISQNSIILIYSWGDNDAGGHAKINATRTSDTQFEWQGWGDVPPKYSFTVESDGSLHGTRQQGKSTSTIVMK